MMWSEAIRQIFLRAIKYLFSACPSHNYLFHENSVSKYLFYPFSPEFTIVIFIHYKPRIAVAILDL